MQERGRVQVGSRLFLLSQLLLTFFFAVSPPAPVSPRSPGEYPMTNFLQTVTLVTVHLHCWKGIILRRAESMQNELQDHKILHLAE